jgi:hypothetical protein
MADTKSPPCLDPALTHLYTDPHRAFFRLLVDDLIARRHLRTQIETGWPSHIALSQTKSGKSIMGIGACDLFGWSYRRLRFVPDETEKSMWGRRVQHSGSRWSFEPSRAIRQPFLIMDELDKAPRAVQQAASKALQGDTLISTEDADEDVEIFPVVLVTSNGRWTDTPEEYRRRSIVLDTRPLEAHLPDDRATPAQRFRETLPRWEIDAIHPPDWPHSQIIEAVIPTVLPGLNDDGRRLYDERGLPLLVLGRAALTGLDLEHSVQAVVGDSLDCAATVGESPHHREKPSTYRTWPSAGRPTPSAAKLSGRTARNEGARPKPSPATGHVWPIVWSPPSLMSTPTPRGYGQP